MWSTLSTLSGAGRDRFWARIRTVARAGEPGEILSGKQRTILPISRLPNFPKFEHNTSIDVAMNVFGTQFRKFSRKDFFQRLAISGRHNSAMTIDRRKFITKLSLYGMSSFDCYGWNQSKVIPLACTLRTRTPNFLRHRTPVDSTVDNADNSQLQTASADRLLSHVTLAASNAGSKQLAHR